MSARPAIIYDASCRFCIAQIERIKNMNRERTPFEYLPNQREDLFEHYPSLIPFKELDGLRFVDEQGQGFIGADAVAQIAQRLPHYGWVRWIYALGPVQWCAKWIYGVIAKNRQRLGKTCHDGSCEI